MNEEDLLLLEVLCMATNQTKSYYINQGLKNIKIVKM